MPHSYTYEAIVLKVHDIGEADRLLILLTKERGKLAARATGVRKLKSRLGGQLLPFNHLTIGLKEGGAGWIVTSAQRKTPLDFTKLSTFLETQQGIEILLSLIHEEEVLPEVFDMTLKFLLCCQEKKASVLLPFTISLLSLVGLLPDWNVNKIPEAEKNYMKSCLLGEWEEAEPNVKRKLTAMCKSIVEEQANRELKATKVALSMK